MSKTTVSSRVARKFLDKGRAQIDKIAKSPNESRLMKHVIIGNGAAGIHAAEQIRHLDATANITVVAGEKFPPYCRPMISLVLEGAASFEQITVRPPDYYSLNDIDAVVGERVVSVDIDKQQVTTDAGKNIPYDRLLIATGADPARIKAENLHLKGIFYMRTEADVREIEQMLPQVRRALVLGGGLVGFKAAYALLRRRIPVTMLIRSNHPLSMQVDEFAGKMILQELLKNGLEVRTGVEALSFSGSESVEKAYLSDGSTLSCEMVIIGKGVKPACELLPPDRIKTDLGILVDESLRTSVPEIFAAGDVAESFDVARQGPRVNALWPVAIEQGRIAGMNMAGRRVFYRGSLSRNIIRIFDLDVLTSGIVTPPEESQFTVITRFEARRKLYRKLVFEGDKLVGLVMLNRIEQGGILMSLINQEIPVTIRKERLLESSFNYSQLMRATA
jgi:nitrite reductase (NADH) large subunit